MSGFIEENLHVSFSPSSIIGGVIGMGQSATYLIVTSIRDRIQDSRITKEARNQLATDLQERKEAAFQKFKDRVSHDPSQLKNSIQQLRSAIDFEVLDIKRSDLNAIESLDDLTKFNIFTNLTKIQYYFANAEELLYLLNERGVDGLHYEEKIHAIKNEINVALANNRTSQLVELFNEARLTTHDLIKEGNAELKRLKVQNIERLEMIIYTVEYCLNMPHQYVFENELLLEIENEISHDEESKILDEIIKIKDEIFAMEQEFYKFGLVTKEKELNNLINSVITILNNDKYGYSTKLEMAQVRHTVLRNLYAKEKQANAELFKAKSLYDEIYQRIYAYDVFLERKPITYNFAYENYQQLIAELQVKEEARVIEVKAKQEVEIIQKRIRKALVKLQLEYITTNKTALATQDIYHIENGNVVTVTIDNNANVRYFVSGVKIDGLPQNSGEIVRGMEKFCELKPLIDAELLSGNDISIKNNELLDPSEKYATEITLPAHTHHSYFQLIKSARTSSKKTTQPRYKRKD